MGLESGVGGRFPFHFALPSYSFFFFSPFSVLFGSCLIHYGWVNSGVEFVVVKFVLEMGIKCID